MITGRIKSSELAISEDGTLYHISLKAADQISKNIFLVGDASRAYRVARYFDGEITFERKNREFITLCGTYKKLPVAVMSTGIGVDNTEIVAVELHILNEYNCQTEKWKKQWQPLKIIRLGTSASPQKDIPIGSLAISQYAIGLDNTGQHYPYKSSDKTVKDFQKKLSQTAIAEINPYVAAATPRVVQSLVKGCQRINLQQNKGRGFYPGVTSSAAGFYAPQGRCIGRLDNILIPDLQEILAQMKVKNLRVVNNEMESSVMFRILGEILGYQVGSICAVLGNRSTDEVVTPEEYTNSVDRCIRAGLEGMMILNHN